ncbi:MAG: hypothetical protein RIB53_12540 [Roseitalea porphyridii]|uniref:helix-hairpin-helix domain-containing protein n=2 Tax=Roseitalea porphyridii TaxID=1852022 RepID=UPI0032EC776C
MICLAVVAIAIVAWLYLLLSRKALDGSLRPDNEQAGKPLVRMPGTSRAAASGARDYALPDPGGVTARTGAPSHAGTPAAGSAMPAETVSTAPSAVPEPAVIRTTTTGGAGKAKPARKAGSAGAKAKTAGAASATGKGKAPGTKGKAAGTTGTTGTGATAAGAAAKRAKGKGKAATAGTTSASAAAKPAKGKGKAATSSAASGGKAKPAAKAAAASAGTPPTKPAPEGPLFTAPTGARDNLTDIKGIGPVAERQLNEQGITTFAQIAALSAADIQRIDDYMPFSDRQIRDWQTQAKKKA